MRIEDLDRGRSRAHFEREQLDDLRAVGVDWDGEVVRQSERGALYADAIARLDVYPCYCTRREIAEAASAPHGPVGAYPGTCRELTAAQRAERERAGRPPALRLRADGGRARGGGGGGPPAGPAPAGERRAGAVHRPSPRAAGGRGRRLRHPPQRRGRRLQPRGGRRRRRPGRRGGRARRRPARLDAAPDPPRARARPARAQLRARPAHARPRRRAPGQAPRGGDPGRPRRARRLARRRARAAAALGRAARRPRRRAGRLHPDRPRRRVTPLKFVRYWLPAIVIVAGIVSVIVIGTDWALEGAAGVVGAGIAIFLVNFLYRIGASGDRERDQEEAARRYFDEHGRWPE